MIDVTLIGTAALMPSPSRALSCAALKYDGHTILFDCGEGTQSAARAAQVNLYDIDIIALSHYHGDHIFGLPGLLQTLNSMERTRPLTIFGPGNIQNELEPILKLAGPMPYSIRLSALSEEGEDLKNTVPGWKHHAFLFSIPTNHRVLSQGYRFFLPRLSKFLPEKAMQLGIPKEKWKLLQNGETLLLEGKNISPDMVMGASRKGIQVVFTGDTAYCQSLEKSALSADLLICDATYGDNSQADLAAEHAHMTFSQAGTLAANAKVARLWLTHYSQMIQDPMEYLENAQEVFPDAECGFDGKNITLNFLEDL